MRRNLGIGMAAAFALAAGGNLAAQASTERTEPRGTVARLIRRPPDTV
jgi:hypothetical protein